MIYFTDKISKTPLQSKENLQCRKDIKNMIPKLRLDMLPNYHLKNTKTLNLSKTQLQSQNSTNTLQNNMNVNAQTQSLIYNQPPNFANININKYSKK